MSSDGRKRIAPPTPIAVVVVLLGSLMGGANEGGYFVGDWAPAAFVVAALLLVISVLGWLRGMQYWWSMLAIALFAAYTAWTSLSLSWSPNQGDAWLGAGQTLLYLLVFWITVSLIASGALRRWILLASTLGPGIVALFTLLNLTSRMQYLFENNRLFGTIQYYNGEAAFLLVPFWVAVYLAGSRRINPFVRGLVLTEAVLSVAVAVLTQSRGAMVAMAISLPVFFLLSGQRLRGLLALIPIVAALYVTFPGLNDVYLAFLEAGDPDAALNQVLPTVWLMAAGAGLFGLLWGLVDQRWKPPVEVVRLTGSAVVAGCMVVLVVGSVALSERVGDPVAWGQQKWEAFKADDDSGQERSRYLSVSGNGRYTLWQVAWKDFVSHPVLGVGTQNYEATYYKLREQPNPAWVRQPHSLPLEVLSERGIVGGVLFFGFLATCLAAGVTRRFWHLNPEGKALVGAATAGVTYWFVHCSAEWFWQLPAVTLTAVVYLAVLVAPWERPMLAPTRWPLRAVGAGVAVAAIAAIVPLYLADLYLQRSEVTEDPWVAIQAVERAQEFNPVDPWMAQREAELALRIGDWSRAEDAYRRAARLNPEHYVPYYLLALLNEKQGAHGEALSLYRKASFRNPLDEEIKKNATQLETEAAKGESTASDNGSVQ
jgi:hypothetical protein